MIEYRRCYFCVLEISLFRLLNYWKYRSHIDFPWINKYFILQSLPLMAVVVSRGGDNTLIDTHPNNMVLLSLFNCRYSSNIDTFLPTLDICGMKKYILFKILRIFSAYCCFSMKTLFYICKTLYYLRKKKEIVLSTF